MILLAQTCANFDGWTVASSMELGLVRFGHSNDQGLKLAHERAPLCGALHNR
jgi:hypothetical protein